MPEIDENQLAGLRGLSQFVQKAMASPKHRTQLLRIQKDLYPEIAVPEIDAADPVLERVDALAKAFEEDKKAREEAAAKTAEEKSKTEWEQKWLSGRKMLNDRHYNQEGVEAVEKLMTERGIPDHEAGLALFEKLNPPPPPPLTGRSGFGWFDNVEKDPDLDRLLNKKDYDGFLAEQIDIARRDFRANGA